MGIPAEGAMRLGFSPSNSLISTVAACALGAVALAPWTEASAHNYKFRSIYSFCSQSGCADGSEPTSAPLIDPSGNLFVTTLVGGAFNAGAVIELIPGSHNKWKHKVIHSFGSADGALPYGNLIADTAGNIYGTNEGSGSGGDAFELKPNAAHTKWTLKILYVFCSQSGCSDGARPSGLSYAGAASGTPYDGVSPLYGTTFGGGGAEGEGVIFELKPGRKTWTETVLHSFCSLANCADGDGGASGLLVDTADNLYGTASNGGTVGEGLLFELSPNAHKTKWTEITLHSFCSVGGCTDGSFPGAGVIADGSGNLFGMTGYGGTPAAGVVFKLVPNGGSSLETVLYSFCTLTDCTDGANSIVDGAGLMLDSSGNIFGTTYHGGGHDIDSDGHGGGTVFELNGSERVLYSFCAQANCTDGEHPQAGVVMDGAGNLFGTTIAGGVNGAGTVYELMP
jgi:uncharacterized repeat protein (TIGR03803 family)